MRYDAESDGIDGMMIEIGNLIPLLLTAKVRVDDKGGGGLDAC